jgi:hypothetical protein
MSGLDSEFQAAVHRLHDDHHVEKVVALGVPRSAIFGIRPLVGVADIDADDSGFFTFIEDGRPALILPEGDPYDSGWLVVDELIAVVVGEPGRWWLRRGDVPILGRGINDAHLDYCATLGEPIMLYESPLGWLQAGGRGLVVLDWTFNPLEHFVGLNIRCETPALAKRLDARRCDAAQSAFVIEEVRDGA